jgi:hypothetical protein
MDLEEDEDNFFLSPSLNLLLRKDKKSRNSKNLLECLPPEMILACLDFLVHPNFLRSSSVTLKNVMLTSKGFFNLINQSTLQDNVWKNYFHLRKVFPFSTTNTLTLQRKVLSKLPSAKRKNFLKTLPFQRKIKSYRGEIFFTSKIFKLEDVSAWITDEKITL